VGALAHESVRGAHDGSAAGIHCQPQPQRVQRVCHLRSSSRHSSDSCARVHIAAWSQNANALMEWKSLLQASSLDATAGRAPTCTLIAPRQTHFNAFQVKLSSEPICVLHF